MSLESGLEGYFDQVDPPLCNVVEIELSRDKTLKAVIPKIISGDQDLTIEWVENIACIKCINPVYNPAS